MRKKMWKKMVSVIACAAMTTALFAGCGAEKEQGANESSKGTGETYNIGVLQYAPHPALDAANKGFFKALDDLGIAYKADQQNAAGETNTCQTIAETLVNSNNDLIFTIATPAAQVVAGLTQDIPIVLTAVTDPADSGLVESNEKPGGNVTGSSDLTPVKEQIAMIKKIFPEAKTVGMLYCSSEPNSVFQIELAKKACEEEGLEAIDFTVSSSNEIQTIVESAVGKVDAMYSPTDNIIANNMATVGMICGENKIPMICGEENMVLNGGLATYGLNYEEIGYLAGEMAAKILTGESTAAELPISYLDSDKCALTINEETAATLGLDPKELEELLK